MQFSCEDAVTRQAQIQGHIGHVPAPSLTRAKKCQKLIALILKVQRFQIASFCTVLEFQQATNVPSNYGPTSHLLCAWTIDPTPPSQIMNSPAAY